MAMLGRHKTVAHWRRQMAQRGWTMEEIDEAIAAGARYAAGARGPGDRSWWTTKPEKSCMSAHQTTDTETIVFVRLLEEGTDVWRPVGATALPDGRSSCKKRTSTTPRQSAGNFPRMPECDAP